MDAPSPTLFNRRVKPARNSSMIPMEDEVTGEFLEESKGHLVSIEADLLAIEQQGAAVDDAIVNKVFRAAHSIKGGAGFFGFSKIRELAHSTENILSVIRTRKIVPTPDVVNILLMAFDKIRELINNIQQSEEADVSELVIALTGLLSAHLSEHDKDAIKQQINISSKDGRRQITVSALEYEREKKDGKFLYWIDLDLIHDIQRLGKYPLDVLRTLERFGTVLNCQADFSAVGTLDDPESNRIPLTLFFSAVKDMSKELSETLAVGASLIHLVHPSTPSQNAFYETGTALTPAQPVAPTIPDTKARPVSGVLTPQASTQASTNANAPVHATPVKPMGNAAADGEPPKPPGGDNDSPQAETSLRVNVELLERLMTLAGELVLSRNQLIEAISNDDKRAVELSGQRINLVTSELQETIMHTRMQPIGNIFRSFPRMARDLSTILKKDVRLSVSGKEVEMDKTIVEGLGDPLMHMVRNAIDHGIELPEERTQAGKSPTGQINIKAYHEAGQVVIELSDDGRGLDTKKIAEKALASGAINSQQLASMSEKDLCALILLPGVSTADTVTDLSGRGVGMDVVKTNLDKLGGKLDIESTPGKGTKFRIKLPLTLAIIPSLLMSVNGERFAIPQVNVDELIRITAEQVKTRVEVVGNGEVLVLRGRLIPIIHLANILGTARTYLDPNDGARKPDRRQHLADRRATKRHTDPLGSKELDEHAPSLEENIERGPDRRYRAGSDLNIVVVSGGAFQYGLVVEELHDTVEIVVKPLGRHLKGLREYAGATILGDGKVALILDVAGLAVKVQLASTTNIAETRTQESQQDAHKEKGEEIHSFLLFHNAPQERCVVPLGLVSRVEQIQAQQIESLGGRRTMQYRHATLPLFALKDVANVEEISDAQERVVIVFEIGGREVGLIATKPVDAIDTPASIEKSTLRQKGIMGSAIIRGQTTLVVDIFELIETIHPEWTSEKRSPLNLQDSVPVVLLAEDSDFFRSQVQKFLESDGWQVVTAADGQAAWELLQERGAEIRLVITDIEMPRLNGLELARNIHSDPRFTKLPVIALSSLAGEDDILRGQAAGVNDYQIKLDKEKLLLSARKHATSGACNPVG
jgi:two-component system, chemotaxis family, sensor kinase CheA